MIMRTEDVITSHLKVRPVDVDISSLVDHIKINGQMRPVHIYFKEGKTYLQDGFLRMRALKILGIEEVYVEAI